MPSPIGHMLAGAAAGVLVAGRDGSRALPLLVFAAAGAAPDIDLLLTVHRGPTHSITAALVAGVAAWLVISKPVLAAARSVTVGTDSTDRLRFAVAVAAAYATHTLTDWLSSDTTAPVGIMALWPINDNYYVAPFHVFLPVSRRYWLADAWLLNLRSLTRELLILAPLLWLALWATRARRVR
jgi:inner membrane protein